MTIAPHNPKANLKQYDRDFYAWTQEMAAALRSGDLAIQETNLADEVFPEDCPYDFEEAMNPEIR
jgi:hypothetical protein